METPKPKPFNKPTSSKKDEKQQPEKRPYVPRPLPNRSFKDNEGLRQLQSELNKLERRRPKNPKAQRQR